MKNATEMNAIAYSAIKAKREKKEAEARAEAEKIAIAIEAKANNGDFSVTLPCEEYPNRWRAVEILSEYGYNSVMPYKGNTFTIYW